MMKHETRAWYGVTLRVTSRQQKRVHETERSIAHVDTILSKNIHNNFQNLLFKKLFAQSGNQTDTFWNFYSPSDPSWSPKTFFQVFVTVILTWKTSGFEPASTITLVLQANRLSKCTSHPRLKAADLFKYVWPFSGHQLSKE